MVSKKKHKTKRKSDYQRRRKWKKVNSWNEIKDAIANEDARQLPRVLDSPHGSSSALKAIVRDPAASPILHGLLRRLSPDNESDTLKVITELLRLGYCDPTTEDNQGQTPMHILVKNASRYREFSAIVDNLISYVDESKRASYVNVTDSEGKAAIGYAVGSYYSITKVNKLLDLSADPSKGDPTGSSPLHGLLGDLHAHNEDDSLRTVIRLLQLGSNPKAKDHCGRTALHVLAKNPHAHNFDPFLDALLPFVEESERTSFINMKDADGKSAIFYASQCKNLSASKVNRLLDLSADPRLGTVIGFPILHGVLRRRCGDYRTLAAFIRLLGLGCDPKAQDLSGKTALHILAKYCDRSDFSVFVDTLLSFIHESERTSFVNMTDADGKSAIVYATYGYKNKREKINKLLDISVDPRVGDPSGVMMLYGVLHCLGAENQDLTLRTFTRLLEKGCDPRAQDYSGKTALHILSSSSLGFDFCRFVDTLLSFVTESERTSFVNMTDAVGKSAIVYATYGYDLRNQVNKLLDVGADPRVGDPSGFTLLHGTLLQCVGAHDGSLTLRTFIRLLQQGCNPRAQDDKGKTVLHILASSGGGRHFDTFVDTLLSFIDESGRASYVNVTDMEEKSAIFYAAYYHSHYRISKMISIGGDPNVRGQSGQTALHLVAKESNLRTKSRIMMLLLQYGADATIVDNMGNTPLYYLGDPNTFDSTATFQLLRHMVQSGY